MAYLVQTKFKNNFKDFHLNECVYVNDFKTLEPEEEGVLYISMFDELDTETIDEIKSVGLYVFRREKYDDYVIGMSQIKVYELFEGEAPKNGTSYGWFNYQWLPLKQAKKEVETFLSTL